MTDILIPGQHTVIGGIAGQYQAAIARELVFTDLTSERRPIAIFLTDDAADKSAVTHFDNWRRSRNISLSRGDGRLFVTDGLHRSREAEEFIRRIDKLWALKPSPIIVRDVSGSGFKRDPWFDGWAAEVARVYRAKCVSILNAGVHTLVAMPLTDIKADAHWSCDADDLIVKVKNIADGRAVKFIGRRTYSGLVFNAEQEELVS